MLVHRVYLTCSNFTRRRKEIDHLMKTFHEKNDYPKWLINKVLNKVEEKQKNYWK